VTRIAWGLWVADGGGDLDSSDLYEFGEACRQGDLVGIKKAVEKEPDIMHIDDDDGTPLISVCKSDESPLEVVRWLLGHGADPNPTDYYNKTALFYASKAGNASVVKLLLEIGADPTLGSPLQVAANEECKEALKVSLLPFLGVLVQPDIDRGVLSLAWWQGAELAFQLWKTRQVAGENGKRTVSVKDPRGEEGEAAAALATFTLKGMQKPVFNKLMDYMR
jgi:hypothetical protein